MKKICTLLFAATLLIVSCKKPQGFDYRDVRNIRIEKFGFDRTSLSMDLVYFNPNNFGVTLKNVSCDIFINNNFLGHYALDTTLKIDKKSEFVLPSKVAVDMKNVYKNALNMVFNKEVEVNVKGTAKITKIISLTIPFDYKGKHKLF
jgi:LEA14-like dessication related protein